MQNASSYASYSFICVSNNMTLPGGKNAGTTISEKGPSLSSWGMGRRRRGAVELPHLVVIVKALDDGPNVIEEGPFVVAHKALVLEVEAVVDAGCRCCIEIPIDTLKC